jgi:hypothetical protein
MIFTSSTETNLIYKELFSDKNVRTYDSVNNETKERSEVVNWFKNERDAVLINTGVFTKGFDQCDVEVIFMARATKSLSLFIQIAGRGARITNKIEKPHFTLIDGGNNNIEHQIFSFDRDWRKIFFDKKIKDIIENMQDCPMCEFMFPEKDKICSNCGYEIPPGEAKEKEEKLFEIKGQKNKPEIPTIDLNFFLNKGATKYETLKVLKQKWISFLCKIEIKQFDFIYHKEKQFKEKFDLYLRPIYFKIIGSILKDSKRVKYSTFCDQILTETYEKKYNN